MFKTHLSMATVLSHSAAVVLASSQLLLHILSMIVSLLILMDCLNSHISLSSPWSQGRKTPSGRKERTTYSPIQRVSGNYKLH